jgi:hypothetical protein
VAYGFDLEERHGWAPGDIRTLRETLRQGCHTRQLFAATGSGYD